jgi:hypothetical protein
MPAERLDVNPEKCATCSSKCAFRHAEPQSGVKLEERPGPKVQSEQTPRTC